MELTFNGKKLDHYDAEAEPLVSPAFNLHFSRNEASRDVERVG